MKPRISLGASLALALLVGGALFILLATVLFRIDRRLAAHALGGAA